MDYSTSISTSYADTYDKTSSQLSDKLTSTDFSQATDFYMNTVVGLIHKYYGDALIRSIFDAWDGDLRQTMLDATRRRINALSVTPLTRNP